MRITLSILGLMFLLTGCSSSLETGYQPQRLGASSNTRRAYYASPYSAEANAAAQDKDAEIEARRPRPGF